MTLFYTPNPTQYLNLTTTLLTINTFTFMHLADAFIQSNLQVAGYKFFLSVCVFPGN